MVITGAHEGRPYVPDRNVFSPAVSDPLKIAHIAAGAVGMPSVAG